MHMNSAPHLLAEDRPEFERVLDLALRSAHRDPEIAALLSATGQRLDTEQLRLMAVQAMAAISACAMSEYRIFVRVRQELRDRSAAARPQPVGAGAPAPAEDTAPAPGDGSEGAGAAAMLTVLAPVLAGIAALLFLIVGYALKAVDTDASLSGPMVTAGWWFAGLTAAAALVAMGALLFTAVRNGRPGAGGPGGSGDGLDTEAERAREVWHDALLRRGVLPFLRDTLANSATRPGASHDREPHESHSRLGYTPPGFSSHEDSPSPHTRPSFTSPDFTSPELGGQERRRE
ncbi:membrane protein [Streptomyces thioluteus]|uniref:Membrane protein n=1 Tax=Streptomyces thioluteus TaxID=66431 RepID=A0ABN3WMS4_STRTU